MHCKYLLIFFTFAAFACGGETTNKRKTTGIFDKQVNTANACCTAINQIPVPKGYTRQKYTAASFSSWLQNTAVKNDKTVYLYDGSIKNNQQAQYVVLDISVGNKNLQQCADAIMRLRAEYLFGKKAYDSIVFFDNAGTAYKFDKPYERANFNTYLDRVFGMCGSASLEKQLNKVPDFKAIEAGDVIIRGGFPGHAVIVMDVAVTAEGKKVYLLAQSYMPAQDIHVLINPVNAGLSPWYEVNGNTEIITPEYIFNTAELKMW